MSDETGAAQTPHDERIEVLAKRIGDRAMSSASTVAVAESLTGGAIDAALAATDDASDWFAGGVVAYSSRVKFDVLGVTPGPVVTAKCAVEMALGVRRLLGAGIAVSATGAGGPDPVEGNPPGTVFIAASVGDRTVVEEFRFAGDPADVVDATVENAFRLLDEVLAGSDPASSRSEDRAPGPDQSLRGNGA
ncbi:CinA family protein [Agromyces sp. Root1464]|uniref:CinA family protein n=1 Tax=Agromyces sp. Root1464 TaxID=1736467 RepID=UPI000A72B77E|nr:CinA family protein [Agromyces sp. Root1464]